MLNLMMTFVGGAADNWSQECHSWSGDCVSPHPLLHGPAV